MQVFCAEQLTSECMFDRNGFGAGVCFASVCVARHDQADGTEKFSGDGGDAVQCFAGVESIDGQFG